MEEEENNIREADCSRDGGVGVRTKLEEKNGRMENNRHKQKNAEELNPFVVVFSFFNDESIMAVVIEM